MTISEKKITLNLNLSSFPKTMEEFLQAAHRISDYQPSISAEEAETLLLIAIGLSSKDELAHYYQEMNNYIDAQSKKIQHSDSARQQINLLNEEAEAIKKDFEDAFQNQSETLDKLVKIVLQDTDKDLLQIYNSQPQIDFYKEIIELTRSNLNIENIQDLNIEVMRPFLEEMNLFPVANEDSNLEVGIKLIAYITFFMLEQYSRDFSSMGITENANKSLFQQIEKGKGYASLIVSTPAHKVLDKKFKTVNKKIIDLIEEDMA